MEEIIIVLSFVIAVSWFIWLINPFFISVKRHLIVNWKLFVKNHIVDKDPEDEAF